MGDWGWGGRGGGRGHHGRWGTGDGEAKVEWKPWAAGMVGEAEAKGRGGAVEAVNSGGDGVLGMGSRGGGCGWWGNGDGEAEVEWRP